MQREQEGGETREVAKAWTTGTLHTVPRTLNLENRRL